MADISLEKKVLGELLSNLDLQKRYEVEAKWFNEERIRQTVFTLNQSEKNFADLAEIQSELVDIYPKTTVTEEWLRKMRLESLYVDNLKTSLKTLEKEYVKDHAYQASLDFAEYSSNRNKESLEKWLRQMSELDIDEDDGSIKETAVDFIDEMENGTEPGIQTFKELDQILGNGLEGGTLFVIGARPSVGKTAYAINLALEGLNKQSDLMVDMFTLEMTKKQMLKRFISKLTRINSYKFKNTKMALNNDEKMEVITSNEWITKTGLKIHDKRFKISEIERMIRQRVYENEGKPYIAIIDYLGLIDGEMPNAPRTLQVGNITRKLKLLTNELDIPIILLSQLNRAIENRQENRPNLADLRESGDIEQDICNRIVA